MFWFSTPSDFSFTLNNGFEVVLSGKTEEPTSTCVLTLVQRNESDEPQMIWQGDFPSSKYCDLLNLLSRLPKGFGPQSYLKDHLTRISKP